MQRLPGIMRLKTTKASTSNTTSDIFSTPSPQIATFSAILFLSSNQSWHPCRDSRSMSTTSTQTPHARNFKCSPNRSTKVRLAPPLKAIGICVQIFLCFLIFVLQMWLLFKGRGHILGSISYKGLTWKKNKFWFRKPKPKHHE